MEEQRKVSFESLELGATKPTAVAQDEIRTIISADNMIGLYSKAFVDEVTRVNPLRAEKVELTPEEVELYALYLLGKRIDCINLECKEFYKLKTLYVPVWIQRVLVSIGEVILRDKGLKFTVELEEQPVLKDFGKVMTISNKMASFEDDVKINRDVMPRVINGDPNVMTVAKIADHMLAIDKVEHVDATYVAAFLKLRLKDESAMKVLYRVQYDDYAFLESALPSERKIFH